MQLSAQISLARLIVSLACVFALWKYPDYWFISAPILLIAVMFGGMIEGFFIAREKNGKK
jgi:hypothetical protein